MSGEKLRNFFLEKTGTQIPFTSKNTGGSNKKIPPRDRTAHGQFLQKQLNAAWEFATKINEQRTAISLPTKQGIYLEFDSSPDFEIVTKSLENYRAGIRLLNIRTEELEGKKIRRATVYVPSGKESFFIKRIEEYTEKDTEKNKPKNQSLVAGINNIKLAVLESFWQGNKVWIPETNYEWCEIWLSSDSDEDECEFRDLAQKLHIVIQKETLIFPERRVILAKVNRQQLQELIASTGNIAEIRRATETAEFFVDLENNEQVEWLRELISRTTVNEESNVCICILDTGVNNGHALLKPILTDQDCRSYESSWGSHDHNGHGTRMAGIAGYRDLQQALETSSGFEILHKLESSKILPDKGENDPLLYGAITSQSVSNAIIDNPNRKRIICMAITAPKFQTGDGHPTSWSAAIDELTAGYLDEQQKLFFVSAGNVQDMDDWRDYPISNLSRPVQNPGQSWNAVTVGAYTEKTLFNDKKYKGANVVAPSGSLSPYSSTSLLWDNKWPIKPDILLEGGNVLKDSLGYYECEDLSLVTTFYKPSIRNFDIINATSAATAQAAWMAAQIQVEYENCWPETIRALLVHSAEWTDSMKSAFLDGQAKGDYRKLLKICGYGVPNLKKAIECAKNSVNLIIQSKLQPYDKSADGSRYITKEMHIHELPWPKDVLLNLGETNITMRVTLSYFIEPGPGEIGWKDRYRYASCALRFDVNGTDSKEAFLKRINAVNKDDEGYSSGGGGVNWLIGEHTRNLGSIHSDIWSGTAAELATSNFIGIYPAIGWWRERAQLGRWNKEVRYSLIVSLYAPEQSVDLYTPILNMVKIPNEITINIK
jgi:hypothetical protein